MSRHRRRALAGTRRPHPTTTGDLTERVTRADMEATGATYRQLDHWVRRGYVFPRGLHVDDRGKPQTAPGSGYARPWTRRELLIVTMMLRFVAAGVGVETAARWAREAVDKGSTRVDLGGVTVTWECVA